MKIYLFVAVFIFPLSIMAQQNTPSGASVVGAIQETEPNKGHITIYQSEGIDFLLDTQTEMNKRHKGIEGYRIQLFKGSGPTGKKQALEVKGEFLTTFPNQKIYTAYTPPFWRVRVGDYRHKHEALPLLKSLAKDFPNCYIVKDATVNMESLK